MKHPGGQGTFGGIDVLERSISKDEQEKREPMNLRTPDMLDVVMASMLGHKPGGFLVNKTYVIPMTLRVQPISRTIVITSN